MQKMNLKSLRVPVAALVLSAGGLGFIATKEGTVQRAYVDGGGVITICTGHTGPEVKLGQYYTKEQCEQLLRQDADSAQWTVKRYIKVPLYQSEYDTLVDFCFNVGNMACKGSTLFSYINNGDYGAAAKQFLRWKYVKGMDCSIRANNCYGVYQRRLDEMEYFKSEH